ncbi:MAG: hypothetical protein OXC99_08810 [Chloroflexi bacterium]|nr:hypothetical protein [Chloroflexota bacterium]
MLMPRRAAGLVLALLLLTTGACEIEIGGFGASVGPDAPSYPITMYQGGGVFDSGQVEFDDAKAEAPLVVYYFNGQCEQCLGELRLLQATAAEHEGKLTVLAVDMGPATREGDSEDAQSLLAESGATFPAGYTADASVASTHEIDAIPTIAFYEDDGHYRKKIVGVLTRDNLQESVADILK